MMSAKKLFKFLSKAFYFSLISLFVSSAYAISDVGYVGEDETEITVERNEVASKCQGQIFEKVLKYNAN